MVKLGYKQTEIGIIPEDWKINFLPSFGDVVSGGTPSTSVSEYWDGDIAWCTPSDITRTKGTTIAKTERYITVKGLANSAAALLPPGCVLLCTRATIGDSKINSVAMATNQGFKSIIPKDCNITFLFYLLQTKKQEMLEKAIGSTFLEISKTALCSIPLQYPPIPEQQRIAEALSDMDELIASLEKQIAKKKAIKQGAMQELLTGKRRLPGFGGEWERVELGEILDYEQPTKYIVQTTDYSINGTPVLTAGKTFVLGYTNENDGIFKHTPTILFDDFLTVSRYVDFPFKVKSSAVKLLRAKRPEDNLKLIYELMQMIDFQVVDHQRHWISQYSHIYIQIPNGEEQAAISRVLSNMDSEIQWLEGKLEKTKQIKHGMMQQLLTGKIRLA